MSQVILPRSQVILPRTPSKLIRLALGDLQKCESQPDKYVINMSFWYEEYKGSCDVCLAGSVMANTTDGNFIEEELRGPCDDFANRYCYMFLNEMRTAHRELSMRYGCACIEASPIPWDRTIPMYGIGAEDKEGFHKAMNELADAFEASGQ